MPSDEMAVLIADNPGYLCTDMMHSNIANMGPVKCKTITVICAFSPILIDQQLGYI